MLTDRSCVSACDVFSGAVKDLHLGTLIGTRTAGIVGAADQYGVLLNDGSAKDVAPATTPTSPRPSPCSATDQPPCPAGV